MEGLPARRGRRVILRFLSKETPTSTSSQNAVEHSADYRALKDNYEQLRQQTKPQVDKINAELADVNGKLLAVRSVSSPTGGPT